MAASSPEKEQKVPVPDKVIEDHDVNGLGILHNDLVEEAPLSVKPIQNGTDHRDKLNDALEIKINSMLPEDDLNIDEKAKTKNESNEQITQSNDVTIEEEKNLSEEQSENSSEVIPFENGVLDKTDFTVEKLSENVSQQSVDSPATGETSSEPVKSDSSSFLPQTSQESKAAPKTNTTKSLPKARKSGAPISHSIRKVNLAPFANKRVKVSELESALYRDSKVLDIIKSSPETKDSKSSVPTNSSSDIPPTNYLSETEISSKKKISLKKLKKRKRKGDYDFPSKKKNYKKKNVDANGEQILDDSCENTTEENFTNLRKDHAYDKKNKSRVHSPDKKFMDVMSKNTHLGFKRKKFGARKVNQTAAFKGKSVMELLKNSRKNSVPVKCIVESESMKLDSSSTESTISTPEIETDILPDDLNVNDSFNRKRKSGGIVNDAPPSLELEDPQETTVILAGKKRRTDDSGNLTPVITVVTETSPSKTTTGLRSLLPPHLHSSSQPINNADTNNAQPITKSDTNSKASVANSEALRALLVNGPNSNINRDIASVNNNMCKDNKSLTPNGLSYPVTPPKTPDGEIMTNSQCLSPDRDVIPLCCCKINGAAFNKLSTANLFCQALDTVDGKVMGCCNKVTNNQLVRPGVKIPFMAICENHRVKLKAHQCCPGCGHFCTQGKFYQCRKEGGGMSVHNFHKQCQVFKDGKYFCPHCGEESLQLEITLVLNEDPPTLSDSKNSSTVARVSKRQSNSGNIAKMSLLAGYKSKNKDQIENGTKFSLGSKSLTLDKLPMGPDKKMIQKILENLSQERPKKFRNLAKTLYQPAYDCDIEKVIYVLMDGVDPNTRYPDYEDQTALHAASTTGSLSIVHVLVQCGAGVHIQDKTLKTPLMCATENDCKTVIQYLVNAGASVDERGEDGMTVLHYAAKLGSMEVLRYLIEVKRMNVNMTDDGGWTPMIWAAESSYVEPVRYLLSYGADPSMKDDEENTGLHWAAYAGSVDIISLVLEAGCELNTPNEHGDRPLHIAARRSHYECVVLLLARGADVEVKNNQGETPLTVCLDQTTPTWMALKVNKQLKGFAAKRLARPERLLHRDISQGREKNPISCVNEVDDESFPTDYLYIIENVETSSLNINRVITSLQSCRCKDDCSSLFCVCARSSIKCWYDKLGRVVSDFNIVEPPLVFECNRACRCWTNCNNRVVQNGITARMQLFRTNGRGWGVKALQDIPKGSFICEYIGELLSDSEADRREDDSYLFDLDNKDGETYCIDARKYGNIARFVNHLCEPNVIPVKVFVEHQDLRFPRICFFSSREIKAYEELGFDYGEKFWIIKWKQFTCTCGSIKCKYSKDTIQKTLTDYRLRHGVEDTGLDDTPPPPPEPLATTVSPTQ